MKRTEAAGVELERARSNPIIPTEKNPYHW